jgi:hypothetical protein
MNHGMARGALKHLAVGGLMACATSIGVAGPAAAECTGYDPWPPFERFAVGRANQVLVGEVTEATRTDSSDAIIAFRFRVDTALVGPDPGEVSFEPIVGSKGLCAPALVVEVGDRLAIALDHTTSSTPGGSQVGVAAFLNRDPTRGPNSDRMRGAEQLTLAAVRSLVTQPPTDTVTAAASETPWPVVLIAALVSGALAAVVFANRRRTLSR